VNYRLLRKVRDEMKNPFTFSNIVTGPDFCNRKKEQNPDIKALYIDLYGTTLKGSL
jgi:hypothetical protein